MKYLEKGFLIAIYAALVVMLIGYFTGPKPATLAYQAPVGERVECVIAQARNAVAVSCNWAALNTRRQK